MAKLILDTDLTKASFLEQSDEDLGKLVRKVATNNVEDTETFSPSTLVMVLTCIIKEAGSAKCEIKLSNTLDSSGNNGEWNLTIEKVDSDNVHE
jgi:hypothetical protein